MGNIIPSYIRTYVPILVGLAITWLSDTFGVTDLDSMKIATGVTALVIAVYYGIVRWAEERWPQVGWLLGQAKAPKYPEQNATGNHRRQVRARTKPKKPVPK